MVLENGVMIVWFVDEIIVLLLYLLCINGFVYFFIFFFLVVEMYLIDVLIVYLWVMKSFWCCFYVVKVWFNRVKINIGF